MSKGSKTYEDLLALAKSYGIEKNAMFVSCAKQYAVQQKVIDQIQSEIEQYEDLTTTKSYTKGEENLYANPLVRELPKHSDSANKTLSTMLDIIKALGKPAENTESKLSRFTK